MQVPENIRKHTFVEFITNNYIRLNILFSVTW